MLNDSVLDRSDGAFWDSLGEKYLDILSNLGSKLLTLRVEKELKPLETYTTPDDVERHIENEMHNLCAHFHKLVSETVLVDFGTRPNAYVICLKKYGSPCHRFAMWALR